MPLQTGGRLEVGLEELTRECWNGTGQPFPDGSSAALVSWQVPAHESSVGPFDFCIEELQMLP